MLDRSSPDNPKTRRSSSLLGPGRNDVPISSATAAATDTAADAVDDIVADADADAEPAVAADTVADAVERAILNALVELGCGGSGLLWVLNALLEPGWTLLPPPALLLLTLLLALLLLALKLEVALLPAP